MKRFAGLPVRAFSAGMLVCLLFVAVATIAADSYVNPEEAKIKEVIGLYFKGAETGEASYFEQAFAEQADMKFVWDGTLRARPIADAIRSWTSSPPQETWGKIHNVDIIDDQLAHVTLEILWAGNIYIDVMALYKVGDDWKIVNKTFVNRGKPE